MNFEGEPVVKRIQWTPQLVKKLWDGIAQTKLDNLSFGKVAGPQLLDLVSNYLVHGRNILDFGAGSGHVAQTLLARGMAVACFEPSPRRKAEILANVGAHQNFLGVKNNDSEEQFDVVLMVEVVEHLLDADFDSVLERVAKFVTQGGYLIVTTPNNEDIEHSSVYCPISNTYFHPWQHVRSFTPSQLVNCFDKIGFSTDFIALVDFSCDAERIENHKKIIDDHRLLAEKYNQLEEDYKSLREGYTHLGGNFGQLVESYKQLASSHKELSEAYNEVCQKAAEIESLRASSLKQFSKAMDVLIEEHQIHLKQLTLATEFIHGSNPLGFWKAVKFKLNLLMHHRALIDRLQVIIGLISHNITRGLHEISNYIIEQKQYIHSPGPMTPLTGYDTNSLVADIPDAPVRTIEIVNSLMPVADEVNLRIGKESTIVYVGVKR